MSIATRNCEHYVITPWLKAIPAEWSLQPVKTILTQMNKPVGGDWSSTTLLSLTQKGVIRRDTESGKGKFPSDFSSYQHVKPGDLVFCLFDIDETPRAVGLSRLSGMVTGAYSVFEVNSEHSPEFLSYLFHWLDNQKALKPYYTGLRKVVRPQTFGAIKIPIPPVQEQNHISRFLNYETAKIDALITEQQRLVELLQEKRQAVISHAVTKGLNPDAPMKDSGVEWLGEVPEHWEIRKASQLFTTQKGRSAQELTKEFCAINAGPHPVYSGQTENHGVMGSIDSFEFDYGERGVILSTTVGAKAMSIRRILGKFSLSQNCMIIAPRNVECLVQYFEFGFAPVFSHERSQIPDHMQPSFRMEDFYQFRLPVPPSQEQLLISRYLRECVTQYDLLVNNCNSAIVLLEERRSTLISAAVTGQIDVRGYAPEASVA